MAPDPISATAGHRTESSVDASSWRQPPPVTSERDRVLACARGTDAFQQLARCFAPGEAPVERLSLSALGELAEGRPVDPNRPAVWGNPDAHATAVLQRHGITRVDAARLDFSAVRSLIAGQANADRAGGLDWTRITAPASRLDDALRRAHAALAITLDDPRVWAAARDQRRALARRAGLGEQQRDDIADWALSDPDRFDAGDLRSWQIASPSWLALADEQLAPLERVERPVGVLVLPTALRDGWQLTPTLSLDAVRLIAGLGGRLERGLRGASLPLAAVDALLERVNPHTLHAGGRECLDSGRALGEELTRALEHPCTPGAPRDARDRWGRLLVSRHTHTGPAGTRTGELHLRVLTFAGRGFPQRRLGSAPRDQYPQPSASMDLGEAVQSAVDRGLPLLLSSEAAAHLADQVRVGRMKGRPGMLTITTADGLSASTRRVVAEQALPELRTLQATGAPVVLDAGARQVLRMVRARPLADDPVLLGRQRDVAALKVVGSGVDASATGAGKTVTSARALAHRATTTRRLRALVVAEGRLLGQWRDELTTGAPGRGLPALAPNVEVLVLDDQRPIAAQIRTFDRALGDRAGVVLCPNGALDRFPGQLEAIAWHLLIADEALRYANPSTHAHQALERVRLACAADCWLLTATPRGKTAEHLDVLVGLALGDEAMIRERLNTREAGDLMDELNAHRLRVNYGPHLVRVTRQDLAAWMPDVRPAQPLAIDPDPALAELLEAIRQGGRDAYRRLLRLLRELQTLEGGTPLYKRALAELARAQGVVLGNVGVFVDASVDPETLLHSRAALARALARGPLIAAAMRGGGDGLPLLRGITAQTIAGVAGEEQVLVFAERVRCLRQLAGTLCERHGVEAHVGDGSLSRSRFETMKAAFCAGRFPVLCLSQIGHEGHNFQNASTIVHLDLPWLQTGLEQRVGRAARPGAVRGAVQTVTPYIKRGGIEHVVSVLARRGAEHHQILDSFEGVRATESTLAAQLAAITGEVAESKDDAGYAGTAAKLRVAASVFGV